VGSGSSGQLACGRFVAECGAEAVGQRVELCNRGWDSTCKTGMGPHSGTVLVQEQGETDSARVEHLAREQLAS
jgi:hypothetical protein